MTLIILLWCAVILRLFFLQVISGGYFKTQAGRQQNFSGELRPRRGNIYLRERAGALIPFATTKEGYLAFISPKKLKNINKTDIFLALNKIIVLDKEFFFSRLAKSDDPYEIIAHRIDKPAADKITALNIDGLGVEPEEWRLYPAKTLASQVVGFLGYKGDKLEGRYGIEKFYEATLKGEPGFVNSSQSAGGIILDLGQSLFNPPREGYDVLLTLEPNSQAFLEKKLLEIKNEWHPTGGGGIVIEPRTGKILAMASFPNFDPNSYGSVLSLNTFKNPAVESVYEFGSVFKSLTMAAGLNQGVITPDTKYNDKGFLELDGRTIRNFDGKGRGIVTMQTVLNESLNTGAAFVASELGHDNMKKYFQGYGLGEKTGITLPGEVAGNLQNLNSRRDVEFATAAFGQGIAVTPLEFASAASALANGGKIMKPYIVERIIRPGEPDIETKPEEIRQILKPETSETISRMLSKVADDALLGGAAKFEHWTTAAKTGTAQIPLENNKGYSDEYLHSFLAYAPAFDSKFLLFLWVERPEGVLYASQSLGKYYQQIMQFLLTYYEIPPDR